MVLERLKKKMAKIQILSRKLECYTCLCLPVGEKKMFLVIGQDCRKEKLYLDIARTASTFIQRRATEWNSKTNNQGKNSVAKADSFQTTW